MMKLKIAKSHLLAALTACCAIVDAKSATPIAACVVIDAFMGSVKLTSTNYHQTVERNATAIEVSEAGKVMVDADDLLKRIQAFSDGEIAITETKTGIDVKQGSAKGYVIGKHDVDTAPKIVSVEPQGAEVDARAFSSLLARMVPAMSTNEGQAHVYAVNVVGKAGRLTAMATDSHVGAIASLTFDGEIEVLIPSPAVHQLRKILSKIDGTVRLFMVGAHLHVFADGMAYSTLTMGGTSAFPPLLQIFPARSGKCLRAKVANLIDAIDFVDLVGLKDDRLHIRPGEEGITLHGASKEGKTASTDVEGACEIQSSISAKYLKKMLEFHGGTDVTLWQEQDRRTLDSAPGGMVCEDSDGALFVVMPLRYDADDLNDGAKG